MSRFQLNRLLRRQLSQPRGCAALPGAPQRSDSWPWQMDTRKANWQLWGSKGLRKLVILALVAVLAGQTRGQTENSAVFKNPSNESIMMYDFDLHELSVLEDPPVGHTLKERPPGSRPRTLAPSLPSPLRSLLPLLSFTQRASINPSSSCSSNPLPLPCSHFLPSRNSITSSQSKHISADCCLLLS